MKKIILVSALLLGAILVSTNPVHAEETVTSTQAKTASVELTTSETDSLLTITSASDLDFGSKAISTEDLKFTENNQPTLVVQDIRGEAVGWRVAASLGEFAQTNAAEGATAKKLKGVQLFYPKPAFSTGSTAINADQAPVGIETASETSFADATVTGVLLDASATPTSKVIINAAKGKGNGLWTATYGSGTDNKIELKIPAGNLAGKYQATLTYTLTDAPVAVS